MKDKPIRTLQIRLTDEDVRKLCQKAGTVDLTAGEVIEHFIGDLICGSRTNGADERMYAEQWFDRCFFVGPNMTFLRYLIAWGGLEDILELWAVLQDAKNDIAYYEKHPDEPEPGEVEEIREVLQDCQEQINEYWNAYTQRQTEKEKGTFDEQMEKVLDWAHNYRTLQGNEQLPLKVAQMRQMDGVPVEIHNYNTHSKVFGLVHIDAKEPGVTLVDKDGGMSTYATDRQLQDDGIIVYGRE